MPKCAPYLSMQSRPLTFPWLCYLILLLLDHLWSSPLVGLWRSKFFTFCSGDQATVTGIFVINATYLGKKAGQRNMVHYKYNNLGKWGMFKEHETAPKRYSYKCLQFQSWHFSRPPSTRILFQIIPHLDLATYLIAHLLPNLRRSCEVFAIEHQMATSILIGALHNFWTQCFFLQETNVPLA